VTISIAGIDLELFERGQGDAILYLHGGGGVASDTGFLDLLASGASSLPRIPASESPRCRTGSTAWTTSRTSISN
jgi:hypothetical protein